MKIVPKGNRILVEVVEAVVGSSIVLPDNVNADKLSKSVVIAVGDGYLMEDGTYKSMPIEVNDEVIFVPTCGNCIRLDPEWMFESRKLVIVDYSAILCVVHRTPEELEQMRLDMLKPKVVDPRDRARNGKAILH